MKIILNQAEYAFLTKLADRINVRHFDDNLSDGENSIAKTLSRYGVIQKQAVASGKVYWVTHTLHNWQKHESTYTLEVATQ